MCVCGGVGGWGGCCALIQEPLILLGGLGGCESEGRRGLWDLGERGQIRHEMATLRLHVAGTLQGLLWQQIQVAVKMFSSVKTTPSPGGKM